jgi:hypothetical protein
MKDSQPTPIPGRDSGERSAVLFVTLTNVPW